jgi:amino acid permease
LFLYLCSKVGRNSSIKTLSEASYQKIGTFFNAMIVVKCLLVATLYLSIAISTVNGLFEGNSQGKRNSFSNFYIYLLKGAIIIFTIPLSFLKTIGKLKYTSYAGVLAVIYLVFFSGILFLFYRGDGTNGLKLLAEKASLVKVNNFEPFNSRNLLSVLPSFMFAFTCHQNVFPFYNEARDNSLKSMFKLVTISVLTSLCLYSVFAVCIASVFGSYLLRLEESQKTILTTFTTEFSKETTFIAYSAKFSGIIYVFLLLFSFPLQILPLKISLLSLLPISPDKAQRQEKNINVILSLFSVCACILIYLVTLHMKILPKLSSIVGAFSSPLMMSTFPAIYLLKMEKSRRWNVRRILVAAFGVTGLVLVPLCLYSVLKG